MSLPPIDADTLPDDTTPTYEERRCSCGIVFPAPIGKLCNCPVCLHQTVPPGYYARPLMPISLITASS